jgi:hypothetical protein
VGSPRTKEAGKEKVMAVEAEKVQVKEQIVKQLKANPEAGGTTWVQVAAKAKPKGTPRKTEQNQAKIGEYLVKKPYPAANP